MSLSNFYNNYHSVLKIQKRVIGKNDFTYREILGCIDNFIPKNSTILDIGSASGTLSYYFSHNKNNEVHGVEISKRAVKFAQENARLLGLKKIKFFQGDIMLTKLDRRYDFISCLDVMEHIKDDNLFLEKIHDWMDRKSLFALSVPSINAPLYRLGLLDNFDRKVGHLRRYSERQLRTQMRKNGFRILKLCKSEGVLRNLLFIYRNLNILIRLVRLPVICDLFRTVDRFLVFVFGESQIILVARKK